VAVAGESSVAASVDLFALFEPPQAATPKVPATAATALIFQSSRFKTAPR
jgi:hypothetical protein